MGEIKEYEGVIAEMIFHNKENGYTVAVFELARDESGEEAEGNIPSARE